jgi:hypothetical protein
MTTLTQPLPSLTTPKTRRLRRWRALHLAFLCGLPVALFPFFHTLTDGDNRKLLVFGAIMFLAHLALTLSTLSTAVTPTPQGSGAWETFALTGVSARAWVQATTTQIFRRVWRDHALFALLRLGFAVAFAEFLHMDQGWMMQFQLGNLFYQRSIPHLPLAPELVKIALAGIVIAEFSLLEAHLLSALGTLMSLWRVEGSRALRIGLALLARALLTGLIVLLWSGLSALNVWVSNELYCGSGSYCATMTSYAASDPNWWTGYGSVPYARHYANLSEMMQIIPPTQMILSGLGDNATMLTIDLLRPSYGILAMIRSVPHLIGAAALYIGLIVGLRRLAAWLAVRRGMLP